MPPFRPGWILLQVTRPARSLPLRRQAAPKLSSRCRNVSTTTRCAAKREVRNQDIIDEKIRVNVFDEDGKGTARRRTSDLDASPEEAEELNGRIQELEHDIQDENFSMEMTDDMVEELFTEDERSAIMGNLEQAFKESEMLPHQIHPPDTIPRQSQIYLDKLNSILDQASLESSREQVRKDAWKWYERCKTNVPNFLKMVPKAGWDVIWKTQSAGTLGDVDRSSHLRRIAQDKTSVGWELSPAEQLAQLEGLYLDGQRHQALSQWTQLRESQTEPEKALLESGIHLFALEGQPQRAHDALDDLFRYFPKSDPRTILSVISCCCNAKDLPRAWDLYQRLKGVLGSEMKMEDFDELCKSFMVMEEKDAALAVFRDMVLSLEKRQDQSMFQPMKHFNELMSLARGTHETNSVSLQSMTFLPRRFQNKIFYASWLKKLIGEGDVDAASMVIDLMYERGVKPDAKHLNGLIGAWLRDGSPRSRKDAEERGWTMIQKRIDFTKARRLDKSPNMTVMKRSVEDHDTGMHIPVAFSRPVPAATIETFCLLVQHYLRRNEFGHVRHLRDLLVDAEIPMNSFFMNHLLHAELRNRGYRAVYSRFEVMTRDIKPDFETWIILWQCMKHHLDTVRNQDAAGFPTPRDLFARMMRWFFSLRDRELAQAREDLDIEGYNDILRGLCLARDLEGVFVGMHALHRLFGVLPDERTAHMLILMIARLDIQPATKQWLAHRVTKSSRNTRNIAQTTEVLDIIRKHRASQMAELGVEISALGPEARAEENHKTLLSLVFAVISRRSGSMEEYHAAINAAAAEMEVDRFDIQETMALTAS
ncbi:hypothetical protein FH972_025569 [Carpinus fangiana]|uniref:Pentacotripeptide-repeat region of PRORP domain-containing protein n=1 Tax=Carpinus fangiana TaxID=176857 RepID=A0A5N6L2E6_9ROSI|nr:hypothetical protein FH972_025569 [Carpinus fangiana]